MSVSDVKKGEGQQQKIEEISRNMAVKRQNINL